MSLGGYKFVGYKFALPADYDSSVDAQVIAQALRLHKCKLKAFMSSCALTHAEWGFSEINGDASFEDYGNVIYKLDADGFNYASFLRYGTESAYYCILTISKGTLGTDVKNYYLLYSTSYYHTKLTNNLDSIGIEPITFTNVFSTDSNAMYHRLTFLSQDDSGIAGSSSDNSLSKSVSAHYCGYAVKGKNIISIFSSDFSSFYARVLSIGSLTLSSPGDTSNMFSLCTSFATVSTGSDRPYVYGVSYIQVNGNNGKPYELQTTSSAGLGSYAAYVRICLPQKAMVINPGTNIPYENAVIGALDNRLNGSELNLDGITSKGSVDIDLLAVNCFAQNTYVISAKQTCADGNYLCVSTFKTSLSADFYYQNSTLYIGWDSSNPDFTVASSWTDYPE